MPVPKRKPAEANDGSYAGMVLAAYDAMEPSVRDRLAAALRDSCKVFALNEYALADELLAAFNVTPKVQP